jgi:hypothetical protein
MRKLIALQATLLILFCSTASFFGQSVPEEAKRHFDRGMAAVEMAKSPDDYAPAIKEFVQAKSLAPDWPVVYYNLGKVQEKVGKYSDAITNLKQYLRLAPNASDAEMVKTLINKLEYKVEREQLLTNADIVDILVSLGNEETWGIEKRGKYDQYNNLNTCNDCGFFAIFAFITSAGSDRIKVPNIITHITHIDNGWRPESSFNIIKIDGPVVKFISYSNYCGSYPPPPGCHPVRIDYEIEVVSRTLVKVREIDSPGESSEGKFAGEYRKK